MRISPNAPRFHALWQHRENRQILLLQRSAWDSLKIRHGQPVLLHIDEASAMPFGDVVRTEAFRAAVAQREAEKQVRLSVYRYDSNDVGTPINVDHYTVLEGFPPDLDVWGMIDAATTDPGPNFQRYRDGHVFLVKENPGGDHWLPVLPADVVVLLEDSGKKAV